MDRKKEGLIPFIQKRAGVAFDRIGAPQPAEMARIAGAGPITVHACKLVCMQDEYGIGSAPIMWHSVHFLWCTAYTVLPVPCSCIGELLPDIVGWGEWGCNEHFTWRLLVLLRVLPQQL